jgi:hypothetical protein
MRNEFDMVEAAIDCLKRGWAPFWLPPAILGDKDSGKSPCILWKNFQATLASVKRQFNRPCGIALNCGKSNLVVIDIDKRKGLDYVLSTCAPTGTVVETGRGGRHFYYTAPEGISVRNRQNILDLGIDVRADGGYVVAPPTLHWTGNRYRFLQDDGLATFDPAWFPEPKPYVPSRSVVDDPDVERRRQIAERVIGRIESIAGQGGDMACFKAACACIQFCDLPFSVALNCMRAWNATNARPPWPETRLVYKLKEALRLKSPR